MIDNLPYYTRDIKSIESAYLNEFVTFISDVTRVIKKTGELYYNHKRQYHNLTLIFQLDNESNFTKLTVRGSIHTLFNNGDHNANNFTLKDFKNTLITHSKDLGIDLKKCVLLPLEYGINLFLNDFGNYNAKEIVLNTICEQRKMFNHNVAGIDTSKISGSYQNETRMKVYDKSEQFQKYCNNTLRIETQQKKMRDLNKNGIIYVSDLLELKNHLYLYEKYMTYIKNLVIVDYTIQVPKRSKYYPDFIKFKDANYWRKLIADCKNGKVHHTKYNEKVMLLNMFSKKHGTNLLQKIVQHAEIQYLKNLGLCSFSAYTNLKKPKHARVLKPKHAQLYNTCILCNPNSSFIINKQSNIPHSTPKKCLVSGIDISMQKPTSFLLSITGLKHLHKHDRLLFEIIKQRYCYPKYKNADFQTQIIEIYHGIRDGWRRSPKITASPKPIHSPAPFVEKNCNKNCN